MSPDMYHYMKTVHAGDTRNRLIQGIAGLCVRYYRFPDDEEFELVYGFMEPYGNP